MGPDLGRAILGFKSGRAPRHKGLTGTVIGPFRTGTFRTAAALGGPVAGAMPLPVGTPLPPGLEDIRGMPRETGPTSGRNLFTAPGGPLYAPPLPPDTGREAGIRRPNAGPGLEVMTDLTIGRDGTPTPMLGTDV